MINRTDPFTPKMFRRFFVPSVITSLGLAMSDMADAIVVGSKMGEVGLAAIGMSLPFYMIMNVIMHGFGIGGSVDYSHKMGEGREKEAVDSFNKVIKAAFLISVLIGLAVNLFPQVFLGIFGTVKADGELYYATLSYLRILAMGTPLFFLVYILNYYLRNDNKTTLAGAGFIVGTVFDVSFSFILVIICGMETTGAAIATLIGLAATLTVYAFPIFSKKNVTLKLKLKSEGSFVKFNAKIFRNGFSSSSQYIYQMLFLLIANNVLMHHMGESGVAVFDMIQNASYLIVYLYDASAKALQPLASTLYGEKNMKAVRLSRRCSLFYGISVGLVAIIAVSVFPQYVCKIFGIDGANTVEMGIKALRIYCFGASFAGIGIILESYYQSVGEERSAFAVALLRGGIVLIPSTVIMGIFFPEHFWYIFPITEISSLILLYFWRKKEKKKHKNPLDETRIFHAMIKSDREDIGKVNGEIEEFCEKFSASIKQSYFVTMAVEEISIAIIEGGFKKKKNGLINITLIALQSGEFELHIRDNATSFNPFSLDSAKAGDSDGFDMDAIGMTVIKKKSKEFYYRRYQGFNSLVVKI